MQVVIGQSLGVLAASLQQHGISHMMQDIGRKYVRYINHTYKRSGTLWEGRYKASLIDSEVYLLTCMRYIEMNPVRAIMVQHPGQYRWSSYSHNASGITNHIIQLHPVYNRLASSKEERQYLYRELFRNQLDKDEVHSIRDALNQELVLGA